MECVLFLLIELFKLFPDLGNWICLPFGSVGKVVAGTSPLVCGDFKSASKCLKMVLGFSKFDKDLKNSTEVQLFKRAFICPKYIIRKQGILPFPHSNKTYSLSIYTRFPWWFCMWEIIMETSCIKAKKKKNFWKILASTEKWRH